jgi:hypothetical protein
MKRIGRMTVSYYFEIDDPEGYREGWEEEEDGPLPTTHDEVVRYQEKLYQSHDDFTLNSFLDYAEILIL